MNLEEKIMTSLYDALCDASNEGHGYDYVVIDGNGLDGCGFSDLEHKFWGSNILKLTDNRNRMMSVDALLNLLNPDDVVHIDYVPEPILAEFDYVEYGPDITILYL